MTYREYKKCEAVLRDGYVAMAKAYPHLEVESLEIYMNGLRILPDAKSMDDFSDKMQEVVTNKYAEMIAQDIGATNKNHLTLVN